MEMIKWIKKNIWTDPVWSTVVSNGIIFVLAYCFYKFTNIINTESNDTIPKNTFDNFINKTTTFFQTDLGQYISYVILALLTIKFIINVIRIIRSAITKYKFNKYRNDIFWRANFKWKWKKYGSRFQISTQDIEKVCPDCQHDLVFRNGDYYFTLKCNNCEFESDIFYASADDPNAFVLNHAPQKFLTEFNSKVRASLRQKGLI